MKNFKAISKPLAVIVVVLIVLLALVAILFLQQQQQPEPTIEFTVEAFEYGFLPSTIPVSKGDIVRIEVQNTGTIAHNFVIDEFNVNSGTIATGRSTSVLFTADTNGTFTIYCSIPGHLELGMDGQIIVQA